MSLTPLEVFAQSQNNANILNNTNFDVVAAEQRREVIDQVNAEPTLILTDSRNFYIVGDSPTGTVPWTDNPKKLALWRGSAWFFWTPARNQIYSKPDGTEFQWDGTDWVTPGGGGGGSQRSGLITMSGDQSTDIDVGDPIQFDQQESGGDLDFDSVNHRITLREGIKVRLEGVVFFTFSGSSGRGDCKFFDFTNTVEIGLRSIAYSMNASQNEQSQPIAIVHIVPSTDIVVELRIVADSVITSVDATYTYISCQEIS